MDGSKFKEILTDHVDENGAVHIDGYKTTDPNEEGAVIGVVINGEPYYRDPENQFDPYVIETVAEIKKWQKEQKEILKEQIKKAVTNVVYDLNAKPRLTFTDGSPLEKKLSLIDGGVDEIMKLLKTDIL